jgi:hypothetical protein
MAKTLNIRLPEPEAAILAAHAKKHLQQYLPTAANRGAISLRDARPHHGAS